MTFEETKLLKSSTQEMGAAEEKSAAEISKSYTYLK